MNTLLAEISKISYGKTKRLPRPVVQDQLAFSSTFLVSYEPVEMKVADTIWPSHINLLRAKKRLRLNTFHLRMNPFEDELCEVLDELRALDANWDEEGALKPDVHNIDHAEIYVRKAFAFLNAEGGLLTVPELNAGPDGSVDVVWRKTRSFLIINFSDADSTIGSYYFDQDRNETLGRQGRLDIALPIPFDFQFYLRQIAE